MDPDPQADYAHRFAQRGWQSTDSIAFHCVAQMSYWQGRRVLDIGCGAGRSTRFLTELGALASGVDHNPVMITEAQQADPDGEYLLIEDGAPLPCCDGYYDAVFSSWALLEMGESAAIVELLRECRRVLRPGGVAVVVVNTVDFYAGRWVSVEVDFPENQRPLRSGHIVKARLLPQGIVVTDYFWSDADYRAFFAEAGLVVGAVHYPLGAAEDGVAWKDEARTAPFAVYELTAG